MPDAVTKWMIKMKEFSLSHNGQDGTLGDYPVYIEPVNPAGVVEDAVRDRWKIDYAEYVMYRVLGPDPSRLLPTVQPTALAP